MSWILRLTALALVVAAIYPRGEGPYERVLVIALDGVHYDYLARLADSGELPAVAKLRAHGVEVQLFGGASANPLIFWAQMFSSEDNYDDGGAIGTLASGGRQAVLVGVPGTSDAPIGGATVLPGADAGRGFIGDSTGRLDSLAVVRRGALPWPYDSAAERLARLAEDVEVGGSSAWLEVHGDHGREGVFKAYRLDDSTYYLSPVYRRTKPLPAPINEPTSSDGNWTSDALYVADDPSTAAATSRKREYLSLHAAELSRGRAEAARRMMAGNWDAMVVFETLPGISWAAAAAAAADRAGAPSRPTVEDVSQAYSQVDAQLARLVATAGTATLVVLLGREVEAGSPMHAARRASTGFLLAATDEGASLRLQAKLAHAATTLLTALGLPLDGTDAAAPIAAVTARYRRARGVPLRALARRPAASGASMDLSASTLGELGALATSAAIPAESDAIVQPEG